MSLEPLPSELSTGDEDNEVVFGAIKGTRRRWRWTSDKDQGLSSGQGGKKRRKRLGEHGSVIVDELFSIVARKERDLIREG
jgi:hypothetical protein